MYICEYCGKTTEEIETRMDTCEHCGGEFVEAKKCLICEDWISEYGDAICESCFEEYSTVDNAFFFGGMDFLKSQFSEGQIEQILLRELREAEKLQPKTVKDDIEYYISEHAEDFARWAKKKF